MRDISYIAAPTRWGKTFALLQCMCMDLQNAKCAEQDITAVFVAKTARHADRAEAMLKGGLADCYASATPGPTTGVMTLPDNVKVSWCRPEDMEHILRGVEGRLYIYIDDAHDYSTKVANALRNVIVPLLFTNVRDDTTSNVRVRFTSTSPLTKWDGTYKLAEMVSRLNHGRHDNGVKCILMERTYPLLLPPWKSISKAYIEKKLYPPQEDASVGTSESSLQDID